VSLTVRNIRVYSTDRDAITVTWEIAPTTVDLSQYTVSVLRSESHAGPYNRVSMEMVASDVYDFQDRAANILSKWREFYYRIRLTETATNKTWEFGSEEPRKVLEGADPGGVTMEPPPDLIALEAIRRFDHVVREYAGRRVIVMVERTWGQRCPDCWDALKRRSTKSRCMTCFDTGINGGYFQPMEAFAMKPPHKVMTHLTPVFELQAHDAVMWFSSRPRLKPRDIVIDVELRRWRVIAVHRSEKSWALTRQTVQVRMLSRDQVEYKIPLKDWDRDSVTAGAMRERIRATDIDSYNRAVAELGLAEEEVFPGRGDLATNTEHSNAPTES
jgi:hypothetical protein